ncbi:hypothetical protein BDF21DRAFT_459660 [Thamnidium elegans]|nr:hypothetical protein BDF21DRAFT_459660 [Thamnidium elegans]
MVKDPSSAAAEINTQDNNETANRGVFNIFRTTESHGLYFGRVVEGLDVVKKVETLGSDSGIKSGTRLQRCFPASAVGKPDTLIEDIVPDSDDIATEDSFGLIKEDTLKVISYP